MNNELRIIISGGGTGGHIFPAVSIANAIKAKRPDAKILFVGALGRMEMQRHLLRVMRSRACLSAASTESICSRTSPYSSRYGRASTWQRVSSKTSSLWRLWA